MNNQLWLGWALGGMLLPTMLLAQKTEKPNVLLIMVDDLRPELGCYGLQGIHSPHIDKLASEGVLFQRAYCNVPVSGATRASLLTGVRPTENRYVDYNTWAQKDNPTAKPFPLLFKENGYRTIANGKIFHHKTDFAECWDENWRGKSKYEKWDTYVDSDGKVDKKMTFYMDDDVVDEVYIDGQTAQKTIADLQRLKKEGKPFFLACGFLKPHLPFYAPKKYWDLYSPSDIKLPDNYVVDKTNIPAVAFHTWQELRKYSGIPTKGSLSDEQALKMIHGYRACVSYTDAQVGKVLAELKRLGLEKNTIVLLVGDHGWNLGEHGLWCKHTNFDTSLHAVMMMKGGKLPKGKKVNEIVEFVDIYPTVCELAGLKPGGGLDGSSMVDLCHGIDKNWKNNAHSRYLAGETYIEKDYHFTEYVDRKHIFRGNMMFDHAVDPAENNNLTADPQYEEMTNYMRNELHTRIANRGLKDYYAKYFPVGTIVAPAMLDEPDFTSLLSKHFNSITAANVMKPIFLQKEEGKYDFADADKIVDYALAHNMKMRGHTLVWHRQTPDWWFVDEKGNNVSKEKLYKRLETYINEVMKHFKGRVYCWDVVNEAMSDNWKENYRRSKWYEICGEEYIEKAFEFAHKADPNAVLFYNDYNLSIPGKRENTYRMLRNLINKGVPIHGLGMQAHISIVNFKKEEFDKAFAIFTSLGLKIQITELDVSIYAQRNKKLSQDPQMEFTKDIETRQAHTYREMFDLINKYSKSITGVTIWGLADNRTWLNSHPVPKRRNYPLLFDTTYAPKKAYREVVNSVLDKENKIR